MPRAAQSHGLSAPVKIRPRTVRRLLWLAGFGCLWLNVLDDPPLRTGAYVQNVTTDGATVSRVLAEPRAQRLVVRDESGAVVAEVESPAQRRHALRATGLIPAFHKHLNRKGIDLPVETFEPGWTMPGEKQ